MFWKNKKKKITDDPDIKYKIEKHEVVRGKNIQYDRNGNLIGGGNPDDERWKPHNEISVEENIEGLFQLRTDVLGKCDMIRMLLESPNKDKHELHIINGKALVEKDIRWHERQKIKYEEIDEFVTSRFLSETIELVKKEKEKWNNLEKK